MPTFANIGVNVADIIVVAVLVIGAILGKRRGLMNMTLKTLHSLLSFGASVIVYPLASAAVRKTELFSMLKLRITGLLGIDGMLQAYTREQETSIINSLKLPEVLKSRLLENNNSAVYKLLGVDSLSDYISGYVANMIMNVVFAWLFFTVFMLLLKYAMKALRIASKLPIIHSANKLGGAALGFVLAVAVIWVAFTLIYVFITRPFAYGLYGYICDSTIARVLYENNPLLEIILTRMF
jgi:hypothetical protein